MATVRLSDAFIPAVYGSYTSVDNPEKSQFFQSGVVVQNDFLNQIARVGGYTATVPFWQDIDPTVEPNYSNDDPADPAVANKIGSASMVARKAFVNQGYGEMDLVQELAGSSPMAHIRNRFGTYWMRQWERRVIAMAVGVLADNVANDAGDMLNDISGLTGDDAKFGSSAFIDAAYLMGDNAGAISAIAVHSQVMARMLKNDEIIFIADSKGSLTLPTYKGRSVIVDDNMPQTGTAPNVIYTSILFGGGAVGFGGIEGHAFAMGEGVPKVPFEVWRNPQAGQGGGMEEIWERKTWLLHPFGFSWVEGTLVELSATLADLRLAAHWNRIVARKQVPMSFIKSKV